MNKSALIPILFLLLLAACEAKKTQTYQTPKDLNDGWEISTPKIEGLDQQKLEKLIGNLHIANSKLDGLVIARHNKLIVDQYYNGYSANKLHKVWSITKAFSGTLIGIATNNGLLSEKDKIYHYLGDYIKDSSSALATINIEHLLTMTSGLDWEELGGPNSAGFKMAYTSDWIRFTLDQGLLHPPGTVFNYSTGNYMILGQILKAATGEQAKEYAKKFLFEPLSIDHFKWDNQSEFWTSTQDGELLGAKAPKKLTYEKAFSELTNTGSGLHMRPRDLCKFGQLYLNKGKWNEQQILSEDWVQRSTSPHYGNQEYGYHWRLLSIKNELCFYASGFGLQAIYVFPKLDLVVVLTQQHYQTMPEGDNWTKQFLTDLLKTTAIQ